jgi:hypothetical protein
MQMIYAINSYDGYQHSSESKILGPDETLKQAHLLKHLGLVGIVPNERGTQIGPFSDMNRDGAKEGFVAEFTQAGVLVEPETGRANVVAFTIDVFGEDDSGEIWLSGSDVLRKSEGVWLNPNNDPSTEVEGSREALQDTASIAGVAMPAMGKLLVVQMIPELSQAV